ncbi:uncharacterized protein LOC101741655 isoform X3 [Bombyx mori]|uniref:Uncharacterized protein n=2 Tax=Bombyx mori TaxID=7091 RepID=A0A8R2M183_BOMMO|nr:uncharacterized protein LOC101741655 isoform X1 [Bombyx mori]
MTSQTENLKTNEFQRRRKLRLQQVREQSKDIAKKIRQRAKLEKLKQASDFDVFKQREYLMKQGELVKQLEVLYSKGIENVGSSHRSALEDRPDVVPKKLDLTKVRAREAASKLRRAKQEKLDEQKRILDRKLQAREVANELSRDKTIKASKKPSETHLQSTEMEEPSKDAQPVAQEQEKPSRNDIATQWEMEEPSTELEHNIPTLTLMDDKDTPTELNNNMPQKSDNSKRLDLFALSEGMPLSLRGSVVNEERVSVKESVNIVSEFLRNRAMRLRETDHISSLNKSQCGDLVGVKETILRTRSSRTEGKNLSNERLLRTSAPASGSTGKKFITMYDHSTRDARSIPIVNNDEQYVTRDRETEEDAYVKAMRESNVDNSKSRENKEQTRIKNIRNRVAMTKESVEKEYKDTMNFLKSLPKDMNQPTRSSYMDENRQQLQQERRQHKMQCEFRKIQRECSRHKKTNGRRNSKSPINNFESGDFQYSWMPVPESDNNLAIHTIPTSVREGKVGNTVKFSKVDSYHEYRSRHKHTPPTKDISKENQATRRIEGLIVDNDVSDTSETSSVTSNVSSSENIRIQPKKTNVQNESEISEADRIIIYKILDSRKNKNCKKNNKLLTEIKQSLGSNVCSKKPVPSTTDEPEEKDSAEHVDEGVYEPVNDKGLFIEKCFNTNVELWHSTEQNCWWNPQKTNQNASHKPEGSKVCQCSKKSKDMEGAANHWDISDSSNRTSNLCVACKCACSKSRTRHVSPPPPLPSAATSTTSFKSATNAANNTTPDSGFIKLIETGGHEAGKFYIGASGFLKNDNYEVVIQLRKKYDENKLEEKTESTEVKQNTKEIHLEPEAVAEDNAQSEREVSAVQHSNMDKSDAVTKASEINVNKDDVFPVLPPDTVTEAGQNDIASNQADSPKASLCDKGVETSFKLSYVMPSNAPKTDPGPRPGTSTYTQTSFGSPNNRPVFFHMSSSTSTAYMSPPELILPRCLKRGHCKHKEQFYESSRVQSREKLEHYDQHHYNEEYSCSCKRCIQIPNKRMSRKSRDSVCYKDCTKSKHTPSNTSSCLSSHRHKKCAKKNTSSTKFNKNENQVSGNSKKCLNRHNTDNVTKKPLQSVYNLKYKDRPTFVQTNLNPVIKSYVSKLLTLNREGLKAVEVVNQDCSSVATPGSSIVNEPKNINRTKSAETQISLEQIKHIVKQKILNENKNFPPPNECIMGDFQKSPLKQKPRLCRKKIVHKVKSFNVSKNLKPKATRVTQVSVEKLAISSSTSSMKDDTETSNKDKPSSKASQITRKIETGGSVFKPSHSNLRCVETNKNNKEEKRNNKVSLSTNVKLQGQQNKIKNNMPITDQSGFNTRPCDWVLDESKQNKCEIPMTTGTQTVNEDLKYVKLAVDKLQNMEKIADLTEKCTKRLSNLAKVLEEVRKNKSLVYSQISSSDNTSGSEHRNEKMINSKSPPYTQSDEDNELQNNQVFLGTKSVSSKDTTISSTEYIPFLNDIPKPPPTSFDSGDTHLSVSPVVKLPVNFDSHLLSSLEVNIKTRAKPPPALSRIHLKHGNDHIIPHELSTVLEVDSPMSLKLKNQSNNKSEIPVSSGNAEKVESKHETLSSSQNRETLVDPDLLKSNLEVPNHKIKLPRNNELSDVSKVQMMDLKQFNEIMLKPFITFQEHAKQCNILHSDFGSEIAKEIVTDEISSLHSDGSLPDVIAELLKRNVISEPFKYDTVSNINSTSISSESTMSVLALSKTRKDKKKSSVMFNTKENAAETSDSLSVSSNPDLEKAFKNLGMGWASSTLKKTKERLALSSSSNTSSSSLSQFKIKSFNNHEIPALVTDSVSSILNSSKNTKQKCVVPETSNVEQQTSLINSITVKDFLKNELAKKITFTNKTYKDDSEEFVSLFDTKIPEGMKHDSDNTREQPSMDSIPSGNNRARTSTPVQVYKSMTYQSSSTSNLSNGLFSNADDLSSVKGTSNSMKNHSASEKDDLLIPKLSLKTKMSSSDSNKSD